MSRIIDEKKYVTKEIENRSKTLSKAISLGLNDNVISSMARAVEEMKNRLNEIEEEKPFYLKMEWYSQFSGRNL